MTALAAERDIPKYGAGPKAEYLYAPVKTATTIYKGALVAITSAGVALPAAATATNITLGVCDETVINSGADGAKSVKVRCGVFAFNNSSSSDEITSAWIGSTCYVVDDNTVAKTDNSAARPAAGKVVKLEGGLVFVQVGI